MSPTRSLRFVAASVRPFALALVAGVATLPAQTTPLAPAAPPPRKPATETEVIALNAFEVQADSDTSYGALNSTSITRFNVEIDKMPVSADIFTETFTKDIAASTVEDVITGYSAGTGYSDGAGAATASAQPGDRNGNFYIQICGMNTPTGINATFYQQPRTIIWTNTLKF